MPVSGDESRRATEMVDQALPTHSSAPARSLSLRDVLTPVFRHWKLVVFTFCAISLGGLLAVLLLPKRYEARMKIWVKHGERVDAAVTPDRNGFLPLRDSPTEEELNSEVELLKSSDLLEKVVLACGLQGATSKSPLASSGPPTDEEPRNERRIPQAIRTLERQLQVEPVKKTSLISVRYDSPDPQLAARVLTTLASLYLEKHAAVHRPPGAFEFFQRERQRYQKELDSAEVQLADFSRSEGVIAAALEKENVLHKITEFDATLRQTQIAIAETEKRVQDLRAQLPVTSERLTTQVRTSNTSGLLDQLKSTLLNLELKRTELLDKFEPTYRPVQEVETQIAQTRSAIEAATKTPLRDETTDGNPLYGWLRAELAKSSVELAALHARRSAVAQVIGSYQDKARLLEQKGPAQQDLIRSAKAKEESYLLYLRKEEEARISDALDRQRIVNVAIAEAATVPVFPTRPGRGLNTLLGGLLLASVLSFGLAFVSDYLDPSLRTPDEVQVLLHLPVLASLPKGGK